MADKIWHRCTSNGTIRPYPVIACSLCERHSPGKDFNAVEAFAAAEERVRAMEHALRKARDWSTEIGHRIDEMRKELNALDNEWANGMRHLDDCTRAQD